MSFGYTISDGAGGSVAGSASIDLTPVNDAPVTTAVTLAPIAANSGVRLITQAQLLANASDLDGPVPTATNLAIATGLGTLVNNLNGTWNYTPALNDTTVSASTTASPTAVLNVAATASMDITSAGTIFSGTPGPDNPLNGTAANDTIDGLAGNDVINGLGGVDTLIGGANNDTFIVDTTTDTLVELAGGGTDTVVSSVTYTLLNAQIENLTLSGAAAINGTGNALNNVITGNTGNNVLTACCTLRRRRRRHADRSDGNDTLDGGTGADTMVGGTGNDTYIVDNAGDVITECSAQATTSCSRRSPTPSRAALNRPDADRRGQHQRHRQPDQQHDDRQQRRQHLERWRRRGHLHWQWGAGHLPVRRGQ